MGQAMLRQGFFSTLIVAVACLEAAAVAHASPPSAAALESQAQAEFAKVGMALRERLEREAAGDAIGARIAEKDADAHRYRFLDIKRELSRLHPPSAASPSVAAPRKSFRAGRLLLRAIGIFHDPGCPRDGGPAGRGTSRRVSRVGHVSASRAAGPGGD